MSDNPDDYDFTPTSISPNLASLFGNSPVNSENSTLIYTAPKQPKPGTTNDAVTDTKAESSVICARVVQVWKLTDGQYAPAGKHGLAIISSSFNSSYEIILYKEKRNVIMRAKISPNLEVTVKKDEFVSFYTSANNNWLIKFNSSDDCRVITKNIEMYDGKVITTVEKEGSNPKQSVIHIDDGAPESKAKDDILTRISRMGQSILPNKSLDAEENLKTVDLNIPTNVNEFKIKDNANEYKIKENVNEYKIKDNPYVLPNASALSPTHVTQPTRQIQNIPNTVIMGQPITYDPLHFYVAENRAHNSEIRINLSQISEKLNNIMKLVDVDKPRTDSNHDALTSKIKVLQLKNENFARDLSTLQQENTRLQIQIKQQEDVLKVKEENRLQSRFSKETEVAMMEEYEKQINIYKTNIILLSETVDKQKSEVEQLKKNNLVLHEEDTTLKTLISEMENTIADLRNKLKECENDRHKTATNLVESKEKSTNFTTMLKDAMNGMYGNIVTNFNEGQHQTSEINDIIAQNIKFTTLKIIHHFQQIYEPEMN